MNRYKFESVDKGIAILTEMGFELKPIGIFYGITPSKPPEGYPTVPETNAPLNLASLFKDGSVIFCNSCEPFIPEYHEKIMKIFDV
jgi:hypothetical protein